MAPDRFSLLLYRTCLAGCLLGGVATLYFVGGLAGYLQHPVFNLAAVGGVFVAALFFLYVFFATMPQRSRLGFSVWSLTLLILLVQVALGFLPPTARDELTHHLALPRLYAAAGRVFEVPFAPYSYYPMLLDMLYTPWVQWGWDSVPKLIHGLFGFLTALLLYAYLAYRLHPIYGLLGFFFFVSTPAILRLGHWAYVDLGVVFYSTAALLCLLRWAEASEIRNSQSSIRDLHSRWLIVAGLSAGFALAAKPNGLLVFLLLIVLLAFFMARRLEKDVKGTLGEAVLFVGPAIVAVGLWWIRNWAWTGNPFFPFFSGLLGGAGESGGEGGPDLGIFARRKFLYEESWWQIALLPLRLFFSGQDDQPQYFDGVLNPMLILFLPWAFKGKWLEEKKLLFAFALFYLLFAVFLTELRIRYILPIVPPLVLLAVYGVHNIYLRVRRPWILFAVLVVLLLLNGVYLWRYVEKVSPLDYLRGRESRDAYLARVLLDYPVFQYVNEHLPPSAKIYLLFMGRRTYYCHRSCFHDPGDNPWILLGMIREAQGGDELNRRIRLRGITHLMVRDDLLLRFLVINVDREGLMTWNSFARAHLRGLFNARGYSVFQFHD